MKLLSGSSPHLLRDGGYSRDATVIAERLSIGSLEEQDTCRFISFNDRNTTAGIAGGMVLEIDGSLRGNILNRICLMQQSPLISQLLYSKTNTAKQKF